MAKNRFDWPIGRYALFQIGVGGPRPLEGHRTYINLREAKIAAERLLRRAMPGDGEPPERVTVFRVEATYWLDPAPELQGNVADSNHEA